jgi:superfamily II DNA/RNA helicase
LISPTRELCQQTYSVLLKLLRALPDQKKVSNYEKYCHCVTGGNDLQEDISKVRGKTIVLMGTVGRIR